MRFTVGVDLGQAQDYTAVTIVESKIVRKSEIYPADNWEQDSMLVMLTVRHVERLPLQTRYTEIVDKVARAMKHPMLYRDASLVVDEGQAGKPVLDMMRDAGLEPIGITITAGHNVNPSQGGFNVPKKDLVYNLVSLFLTGRIKFAKGLDYTQEIKEELRSFQMKTTRSGRETWENSKASIHDDLVMSLALSSWYAMEDIPPMGDDVQIVTEYDILNHGA